MFLRKRKIEALEKRIVELEEENEELMSRCIDLETEVQVLTGDYGNCDPYYDFGEPCRCGGSLNPMYDEHPNWIKRCSSCLTTTENSSASPISEPIFPKSQQQIIEENQKNRKEKIETVKKDVQKFLKEDNQ